MIHYSPVCRFSIYIDFVPWRAKEREEAISLSPCSRVPQSRDRNIISFPYYIRHWYKIYHLHKINLQVLTLAKKYSLYRLVYHSPRVWWVEMNDINLFLKASFMFQELAIRFRLCCSQLFSCLTRRWREQDLSVIVNNEHNIRGLHRLSNVNNTPLLWMYVVALLHHSFLLRLVQQLFFSQEVYLSLSLCQNFVEWQF